MEGQPRTRSPLCFRTRSAVLLARYCEMLSSTLAHAASKLQFNTTLICSVCESVTMGRGLTLRFSRKGHWGLPAIRERATTNRSAVAIVERNAGTEAELTVPASIAYAASHVHRRFGLFGIKTKNSRAGPRAPESKWKSRTWHPAPFACSRNKMIEGYVLQGESKPALRSEAAAGKQANT